MKPSFFSFEHVIFSRFLLFFPFHFVTLHSPLSKSQDFLQILALLYFFHLFFNYKYLKCFILNRYISILTRQLFHLPKIYINHTRVENPTKSTGFTKLQIPNPKRWAKHLQTEYRDDFFFIHFSFLSRSTFKMQNKMEILDLQINVQPQILHKKTNNKFFFFLKE